MVALLLWAAPSTAAELRPTVSLGVADVVGGHFAMSAALRVQFAGVVFVQGEYVALRADGHTDRGPAFQLGLSGRNRAGLRPFVALGGGPVKGYGGDDELRYVAAGVARSLGRSGRTFVQAELRAGLLGESAYRQFTIGVGLSR